MQLAHTQRLPKLVACTTRREGFRFYLQTRSRIKVAAAESGEAKPKDEESVWVNDAFPSYLQSPVDNIEFCKSFADAITQAEQQQSKQDSSPSSPQIEPPSPDEAVWQAIRREAARDAAGEPLLSSFLYASILAHESFERAVAFVLANRLANATMLPTQLFEIFHEVLIGDEAVRLGALADIEANRERDPSCRAYSQALLYYKGFHAIQTHRIAHCLWNRGQKVLALALQSRMSEVFAVDIHPAARIGRGVLLDHGTGVVIGETAVIGNNCSLLQNVTLGGTGKEVGDRHPKICDNVLIGASATVLGNIVIEKGAQIAAGSLVLKPVPARTMVAGSPAKPVGKVSGNPALKMLQWSRKFKHMEDMCKTEEVVKMPGKPTAAAAAEQRPAAVAEPASSNTVEAVSAVEAASPVSSSTVQAVSAVEAASPVSSSPVEAVSAVEAAAPVSSNTVEPASPGGSSMAEAASPVSSSTVEPASPGGSSTFKAVSPVSSSTAGTASPDGSSMVAAASAESIPAVAGGSESAAEAGALAAASAGDVRPVPATSKVMSQSTSTPSDPSAASTGMANSWTDSSRGSHADGPTAAAPAASTAAPTAATTAHAAAPAASTAAPVDSAAKRVPVSTQPAAPTVVPLSSNGLLKPPSSPPKHTNGKAVRAATAAAIRIPPAIAPTSIPPSPAPVDHPAASKPAPKAASSHHEPPPPASTRQSEQRPVEPRVQRAQSEAATAGTTVGTAAGAAAVAAAGTTAGAAAGTTAGAAAGTTAGAAAGTTAGTAAGTPGISAGTGPQQRPASRTASRARRAAPPTKPKPEPEPEYVI